MVVKGSKVLQGFMPESKLAQKIGQQPKFNHSHQRKSQEQIHKHIKSNTQNNFHNHFTRYLAPIESHSPQTITTTIQIITP